MIPRYKPYFNLSDFFGSLFSSRTRVEKIEKNFSQRAGSKYALILPYGRSAYYFLLKAYHMSDREVILPAYTCPVLAGPILETKNTPVFVDSDKTGFNMAPDKIAEKITEKTGMILFTEIWGDPLPMETVDRFKDKGILLTGDYSLSLFSYFENNRDALKSLDAAFFSFAQGKEISALGGGMLITDNEELYNKTKQARDYSCKPAGFLPGIKVFLKIFASMIAFSKPYYKILILLAEKTTILDKLKGSYAKEGEHIPADFFTLPANLQLYIINKRLEFIDELISERHKALQYYYGSLSAANFHPYPLASSIAWYCRGKSAKDAQEILFKSSIHSFTVYRKTLPALLKQNVTEYPNAEELAGNVIMLPLFYGIREQQIKKVTDILSTIS